MLGDFGDAQVTVGGITSRFFTRDGRYFVNTDGPDGEMADFEITHTFGVDPLQQYLVPFPGGRLQALSLAWDTRPAGEGGQHWFHLYPDEAIGHDDELHWTGLQQNWNYMCADCHSTNLARGYDSAADRFETTWSEIDVGCEACHGPAAPHLRWTRLDEGQRGADASKGLAVLLRDRRGVSWPVDPGTGVPKRSEPMTLNVELEVCAACHSRRGRLSGGVEANPVFLDHHMPAFLTGPLYHDDGQIKDEVYVWGSFIQSRMHAAGVTCSDCHDPHSLDLRAEGGAVCGQCHAPARYASRKHHGHPDQSPGADCLACHMPETTYMVVDPRRDHSMRIPRPDLAMEFGTPDACRNCHADQDAAWATSAFADLFPGARQPFQNWARAFSQARSGLPQAEVSLLAVIHGGDTPDIARATAVLELVSYLSPLSGQAVEGALKDASPLVRIAALRTLEALPAANRFPFAGHLLNDRLLAVRIEAGRVLAATPLNQMGVAERAALQRALADYVATQEYIADRPESRVNLGNLHSRTGDAVQAEKYYRQALALDRGFSPAWLNLSDLYRGQGLEVEARTVLAQGLQQQPENATLHHAMGLAQVRGQDMGAALGSLARAASLDPAEPRYAYVYGIALNSAGKPGEAVTVLAAAQARHPRDREIMYALATIERDRGEIAQALAWARRMLELNPADQQAMQLLQMLQGEAGPK